MGGLLPIRVACFRVFFALFHLRSRAATAVA